MGNQAQCINSLVRSISSCSLPVTTSVSRSDKNIGSADLPLKFLFFFWHLSCTVEPSVPPWTCLLHYDHLLHYFPWSPSISYFTSPGLQLPHLHLLDWEKSLTCMVPFIIHHFVKPIWFFTGLNRICVMVDSSSTISHLLGLYRAVPVWGCIEVTAARVWRCIISPVIAL